MTKPWYHAPKNKDGWPLWVPDLWAEDFERKIFWQWRFDVFNVDETTYQTEVYSKVLRVFDDDKCQGLYWRHHIIAPAKQAVMWRRLRIKLGYTELHYVGAV